MSKTTLPVGSADRKRLPLYSGTMKYFPAALAGVANVCQIGNDKHNPGEPLHHARGKSTDHEDCIVRHLIDIAEDFGKGIGRDENGVPQVLYIAWRALALCQQWLETNDGAPLAPGAVLPAPLGVGTQLPSDLLKGAHVVAECTSTCFTAAGESGLAKAVWETKGWEKREIGNA